jgi:hypothetical protein
MILYLVTVLGFGLFFVSAGVATLIAAFAPPWRYGLPVAWRVWVWGTIGCACGYFGPHAALRLLPSIVRNVQGGPLTPSEAGMMLGSMLSVPPTVAIVGGIAGAVFGYFSGQRRLADEPGANG